jgi:hypothetical protein
MNVRRQAATTRLFRSFRSSPPCRRDPRQILAHPWVTVSANSGSSVSAVHVLGSMLTPNPLHFGYWKRAGCMEDARARCEEFRALMPIHRFLIRIDTSGHEAISLLLHSGCDPGGRDTARAV